MDTAITTTLKLIREGNTNLLVPKSSLEDKVPPHYPAFFNPLAKLNRDISIYLYNAFLEENHNNGEITFADAFAGIGPRGLRVAVEVPKVSRVFINDVNELAIDIAKESAALNSILDKCFFSRSEVCKFLISRHSSLHNDRFSIIDLDPFGSPAPFIDCVLRSIENGGLISVTATDTAVLSGIYQNVCLRKYSGISINNTYSNEVATRLLLSSIALQAARLGITVLPVFAHSNRHYFRIFLQLFFSKNQANDVFSNIGYIQHCFKCGDRNTFESSRSTTDKCQICNVKTSVAGQLWIGKLYDKKILSKINEIYLEQECSKTNRLFRQIKKIFTTSFQELDDIPYYFSLDEIGSMLRTSPIKLMELIEKLSLSGFNASRTIFRPTGFKTNASIHEILSLLKN
ncbi:MAG: tRNA (guanine(10)-N(2))-dimethyltransferase [Nitrososphaerales archaeon]